MSRFCQVPPMKMVCLKMQPRCFSVRLEFVRGKPFSNRPSILQLKLLAILSGAYPTTGLAPILTKMKSDAWLPVAVLLTMVKHTHCLLGLLGSPPSTTATPSVPTDLNISELHEACINQNGAYKIVPANGMSEGPLFQVSTLVGNEAGAEAVQSTVGGACQEGQEIRACNATISTHCVTIKPCDLSIDSSCVTCAPAKRHTRFTAKIKFHADCNRGRTPFAQASNMTQRALLRSAKQQLSKCHKVKVRSSI
eukprot:TRINITY_DN11927_c0_g4_i3.p2 TRINITY_DN11927_c0_g4~~TRINITY_DN11927_c0_g4_i3.p2  ORF type:complete len:251 (+),score=23.87 TRINITY_DN11927_c0_g4_i3:50-802(+)